MENTNEGIKTTQNSILSLIDELRRRDLEYSDQLLQAQALKINLKALEASINVEILFNNLFVFSY